MCKMTVQMTKLEYEQMLFNAVQSWLIDQNQGDGIEDHHAVFDVKNMLGEFCSNEYAKELVAVIASRTKGLIVDTGMKLG